MSYDTTNWWAGAEAAAETWRKKTTYESAWLTQAEKDERSQLWMAHIAANKPITLEGWRQMKRELGERPCSTMPDLVSPPSFWTAKGGLTLADNWSNWATPCLRSSYFASKYHKELVYKYYVIAMDRAAAARKAAGWTGRKTESWYGKPMYLTAPDGSIGNPALGAGYSIFIDPDTWEPNDCNSLWTCAGWSPDFKPPVTAPDDSDKGEGDGIEGTPEFPDGNIPGPNDNPVPLQSITVHGRRAQGGSISLMIPFQESGQYDIKLVRNTEDPDNTNSVMISRLTGVISRGIPHSRDGYSILNLQRTHTLTELKLQASEDTGGNLQQINGEVRGVIRTHTGSTWTRPIPTSNPAWIVLDILTGYSIQNHYENVDHDYHNWDGGWITDDQIDFQSFVEFARVCDELVEYEDPDTGEMRQRFRYAFNGILANDQPIIQTVQEILVMARAQLIMTQQGKLGIIMDQPQETARQLFTPSNSWGFRGSRTFQEIPHGFHVKYIDPDINYQEATVTVFRPGYDQTNAKLYEELSTIGVTNHDQAAKYGMYMLAQAMMRSEDFRINVDIESLVVQRGDLVEIQHDVPLLGGMSARIEKIKSHVGGFWELTLDREFNKFDGDVGITLRDKQGHVRYLTVANQHTNGPDTLMIIRPTGISIDVGDLIVVGTKKSEGAVTDKYLVKEIIPKSDLTAEISLVVYAAEMYATDEGQFPVWNPSFGKEMRDSTEVYTFNLQGTAELEFINRQPTSVTRLSWDFRPGNEADLISRIRIQYRPQGGTIRELIMLPADDREYKHYYGTGEAASGPGYYTVTPINALGVEGQGMTVFVGQRVDREAPAAPDQLNYGFLRNGDTQLAWEQNKEPDVHHYEVYWSAKGEWEGAVHQGNTPWDEPYFRMEQHNIGTYYVVAVDTSGNESGPAELDMTIPVPDPVQNVQLQLTERGGTLSWSLLNDLFTNQYLVYYNPDPLATFTDPGTQQLASVDGNTNTLAVSNQPGVYYVVAHNTYDQESVPSKAGTTYTDVTVDRGHIDQVIRFHGRYPYADGVITWTASGDTSKLAGYRVYFIPDGGGDPEFLGATPTNQFKWNVNTVEDADHLKGTIQVQAASIYGTQSAPLDLPYEALRDTGNPEPPTKFFANVVGQMVELNWLPTPSVDVDRYEVRFTPEVGPNITFSEMEIIADVDHNTTNVTVNGRTGTYAVAAFDTSGNKSLAAFQRTSIEKMPDLNVIEEIEEHANNWPGNLNGFTLQNNQLVTDAPFTGYDNEHGEYSESVYTFHAQSDLGAVYEARLLSLLEAHGVKKSDGSSSAKFDAWLEYRTSDSPLVIADWVPNIAALPAQPIAGNGARQLTEWRRFLVSDVTGRFFQFRLVVRVFDKDTQVIVDSSKVQIDMPDRLWSKHNIEVPTGGVTVTFDPEFKVVTALVVSIDGSDDPCVYVLWEDATKTVEIGGTGPTDRDDVPPNSFYIELVENRHASGHGPGVSGRVDIIATGYGKSRPTSL